MVLATRPPPAVMPPVLVALFVFVIVFAASRNLVRRRRLPPGPLGLPIIGNLLQLSKEGAWEYHVEMSRKYGDVVYVEALGLPVVVLNSYNAAHDLLVKRSSHYSDRPRFPVGGEVMGADKATALTRYGPLWRTHRRLWHQHFGLKAMGQYNTRIEAGARALAARLLENDRDTCNQLKLWTVKTVIDTVFGIEINSLDDELVAFAEKVTEESADSLKPGKYLADIFPLLVHVPEWFPGAGWKRFGFVIRDRMRKMIDIPYECTKAATLAGDTRPTFVSSLMEDGSADEETKKWVSGSAYGAGVDTTLATMTRFIFNMLMHPKIQRRAQEEIERVTNGHRLPTLEDKSSLPYIDALIQELLRWDIIGPLSLPHRLVQDDEYRGYTIPKGSMILLNTWKISRDPAHYPDPDEFRPERFLKTDSGNQPMDPRLYCFGIGRRICPGRHFAERALYTAIVTLLATCTISKPFSENGEEYVPEIKYFGETIRGMEPFEACVRPRSARAAELLRESLSDETVQ